jgi:hypothetical protein
VVEGEAVEGVIVKAELVAWSRAADDAKSAANISRVRFAELRTIWSTALDGCADAVSAMMSKVAGVSEVG